MLLTFTVGKSQKTTVRIDDNLPGNLNWYLVVVIATPVCSIIAL
jgi:hypothetical protein